MRFSDRLHYQENGVLIWKAKPDDGKCSTKTWNTRYANKAAGAIDGKGYIHVNIDGRFYRAHQIVWHLHHGEFADYLDHINGDRLDNRIENLRQATASQNNANKIKNSKANPDLPKGVYRFRDGKYIAQIKHFGVVFYLGKYQTPEIAHKAYCFWHKYFFGEFSYTGAER